MIEYYGDQYVWGATSGNPSVKVSSPEPTAFSDALPADTPYYVHNEGVNNCTADKLLNGTDGVHPVWATQISASTADTIILSFGINDRAGGLLAFESKLTSLANQALADGKKVILETPHPINSVNLFDTAKSIRDVATSLGLNVIDQFTYWTTYMKNNNVAITTLCPDGTTPSQSFYTMKGQYAQACFAGFSSTVAGRDPKQQPFASNSIWNMPIGSGAQFVDANINGNPTDPANGSSTRYAPMPAIDEEHIVMSPTSPLVDVYYNSSGWNGGNRCYNSGNTNKSNKLLSVPMPNSYVQANDNGNDCAAMLGADGRTIYQFQPFTRCNPGESATSIVKMANVDLYGPGITGSHGGSGLSAIGGCIRVGELRPGQIGPMHALKIVVYAKQFLYPGSQRSTGYDGSNKTAGGPYDTSCFRWPATTADSYAVGYYGSNSNATNKNNKDMKIGALLAIPPNVDIYALGLETEPGKQIAWTLQNYGAYVVDDAYGPAFYFATECGPNGAIPNNGSSSPGSMAYQFKQDYGYEIFQRVNIVTDNPNTAAAAWVRDVQRLCNALYCVVNNTASTIGGGGTPRQPLAPAI